MCLQAVPVKDLLRDLSRHLAHVRARFTHLPGQLGQRIKGIWLRFAK
jgi:hypothetical protein